MNAMTSLITGATVHEEMDEEDEELGHAETYEEYMPLKCKCLLYTTNTIMSNNV